MNESNDSGGPASNTLSILLGEYNSDSDNENSATLTTNWTECIDKATGHPYYWNIETKEVTWEMPTEYANYLAKYDLSRANHWIKYLSADNQAYFVNERTRRVSWEQPVEYVDDSKVSLKPTKKKKYKSKKPERLGSKKYINKSKEKAQKSYPFQDNREDERIELITTFENKSDTGSSDEAATTDEKKKQNKKLCLVAEYISENEQSDDAEDTKSPSDQPIFAAATMSQQQNILPIQISIDGIENDVETISPDAIHSDEIQMQSEKQANHCTSKENTFASIITGGRSPDSNPLDLHNVNDDRLVDDMNTTAAASVDSEIDAKLFKRKRRIEFITNPTATVQNAQSSGACFPQPLDEMILKNEISPTALLDTNYEVTTPASIGSADPKTTLSGYSNLKKSHVEFNGIGIIEDGTNETDKSTKDDPGVREKQEIVELRSVTEAKLKFLCNGRPEVSSVQAIMIQLDTLVEAYDEGALQSAYMRKWLDNISNDLVTLERDAAPVDWKCLWHRNKSCYYYKNANTGEIRWDYPELDVKIGDDGDEMDICTTPPPNADEQVAIEPMSKRLKNDNEIMAVSLPSNISGEPTEILNTELASFYSDLASIEATTTIPLNADEPESELHASSGVTAGIENPTHEVNSTDSATVAEGEATTSSSPALVASTIIAKKKKKKVRKMEPWRTGNLETWINQWQKAQREL